MGHEPHFEFDLLEAMEACRPGYDDLADASLAPLAAELASDPQLDDRFQRQQKLDVAIGGALYDVPVPLGLAGRLLAAASARHMADAVTVPPTVAAVPVVNHVEAPPADVQSPTPRGTSTRRHRAVAARRRIATGGWWFAAAGAGAAAMLIALCVFEVGRHDPYTPQFILERAINLFATDSGQPAWSLEQQEPPATFPLSGALRPMSDVHWRPMHAFLDRAGVAYELTGPRGGRATLYVTHRSLAAVPDQPPPQPAHQTGSWCASAWQQNGLLYVLVVEGDARAYGEFLDLPRGPVT